MTGLELSYMVSRLPNDSSWPGLQVIESSSLVLVIDVKLCAEPACAADPCGLGFIPVDSNIQTLVFCQVLAKTWMPRPHLPYLYMVAPDRPMEGMTVECSAQLKGRQPARAYQWIRFLLLAS